MSNFDKLMRNSGKAELDRLSAELDKLNKKSDFGGDDDRFWYPTRDKSGNGYAVIRFLPAPDGEDLAFIRRWDHGFKGPTGKWYIELSRTSLGGDERDPVSEYNTYLWNLSDDKDSPSRKQASRQKRRLHFMSNVYIVKDPANPENEGKVKVFKYGKKIFDKLSDAMNPPFPEQERLNPFNLLEGANFQIKIRTVVEGENKWPNYDQSSFSQPGPLFKDAKGEPDKERMRAVYDQEHSLQQFLDPKLFKSYDELKVKLNAVLGTEGPAAATTARAEEQGSSWVRQSAPKVQKESPPEAEEKAPWVEDDDEARDYFQGLTTRGA